ncbi:MAG: trehalase, partial [Cyclobacteriaceae bacterium]|nr:trehalase [Cyclobacteriaceae bacterium]
MSLYSFTPPEELYWELFDAVQMSGIFKDSKTFVDCIPKRPAKDILLDFYEQANNNGFSLMDFVKANFNMPEEPKEIEMPKKIS